MKTSIKRLFVVAGFAFTVGAASLNQVAADTIAYTTSGTETDLAAYGLSGFEFTLNQNINLTQLGFTGLSIGGGDTPHVTLWNATAGLGSLTQIYDTGNIQGSVVSTGPGTDSGAPSFVSVGTPILLLAGQTYLITAPAYWESTFTSGGITTASSVFSSSTFLSNGAGWNGWDNTGYTFTTLTAASPGAVPTAANFQFTPASTPEPSTYLLLGAGLLFLVALRRRSLSKVL